MVRAVPGTRAGRDGWGRGPVPPSTGPRAASVSLSTAGLAPLTVAAAFIEPLLCAEHLSCALPPRGCTERWSARAKATLQRGGGRGPGPWPPFPPPTSHFPLPSALFSQDPDGAVEGVSGSALKLNAAWCMGFSGESFSKAFVLFLKGSPSPSGQEPLFGSAGKPRWAESRGRVLVVGCQAQ